MRNQRIVVYHHPNPEIRSFLVSEEICAHRVEHFRKPITRTSENALRSLGIIGAGIVKDIMAIEDVIDVSIKPKEIRIKKDASSTWQGIEQRVLEILERAIRKKRIRLVKT